MKTIPLSPRVKTDPPSFAKVDDDVFELLAEYRWCNNRYAQTTFWVANKPKCGLMHRIIMNAPFGMEVDHVDGDPLNNQTANLRICTHAENQQNRTRVNKNNTSGFSGVCKDLRRGTFYAQIEVGGKRKTIGSGFKSAADAYEFKNLYLSKLP